MARGSKASHVSGAVYMIRKTLSNQVKLPFTQVAYNEEDEICDGKTDDDDDINENDFED